MSEDIYSLSLVNLALDGSLDLFDELYRFTYKTYLKKLREEPSVIHRRENWNQSMVPDILPAFELLAFRRLRIFTKRIKNVHLQPRHFKYFNFFDEDKVENFESEIRFIEEIFIRRGITISAYNKRYIEKGNEEFEFHETVGDLQHFVNQFKLVIMRAIHEEIIKDNPAQSIFDTRRDVDAHVAERMKIRQNECVVPNSVDCPPTGETLYVFDALNHTACKIQQHRIVSKKYFAQHINGKDTVVLPVHYCEVCNRYMIGSLSLSLFQAYSGKFIVQTKFFSYGSSEWQTMGESRLHRMGYNVINGELTTAERQNILISVIESRQLTFFEVAATIEQDIRMFENNYRMKNAVIKWHDDLKFINEYMISKHEEDRTYKPVIPAGRRRVK